MVRNQQLKILNTWSIVIFYHKFDYKFAKEKTLQNKNGK